MVPPEIKSISSLTLLAALSHPNTRFCVRIGADKLDSATSEKKTQGTRLHKKRYRYKAHAFTAVTGDTLERKGYLWEKCI